MTSPPAQPKLYRLAVWFDPESTAVVTILFGLFQLLLAVFLLTTDEAYPHLFILPLFLGILIVAGGSLTMASERNPSRRLLQGCACSNLLGILGTVIGFCLYCYRITTIKAECDPATPQPTTYYYTPMRNECPSEMLADYCWCVVLLLLLYDAGALVLHCLMSFSAVKALKTN
ncbi:uncharacterized protein V6R79_020315 [Siganus canaliculatus]